MEPSPSDRTLKHLRLTPQMLGDIVDIMSRDGRRAVVKLDDQKLDTPLAVTSADLHSAKEIDVTSYWVDPDRPTWGRRHFVYFQSGPAGAQYFGDSTSSEIKSVVNALDDYLGRKTAAEPATGGAALASIARQPLPPLPILIIGGLLIAALFFMIGRWSVGTPDAAIVPMPNDAVIIDTPAKPEGEGVVVPKDREENRQP